MKGEIAIFVRELVRVTRELVKVEAVDSGQ